MPVRSAYATLLSLLVLIGFVATASADDQRRVALVIGNGNYSHVGHLANPPNDAAAVAEALKKVGFNDVTLADDLDQVSMRKALKQFSDRAAGADIAVVYYAGHGIEVGGQNYLVPIDAELSQASDVDFEAIPLSNVLTAVDGANRLKLVILDACRNNPFKLAGSNGNRAVGRGLAKIADSDSNIMIAYAAKDGTVALDGQSGENSPFAAAFIKNIEKPRDIRLMFGRVRDDVKRMTGGKQEPYLYQSLGGDEIYLNAAGGVEATIVKGGDLVKAPDEPAVDTPAVDPPAVDVPIADVPAVVEPPADVPVDVTNDTPDAPAGGNIEVAINDDPTKITPNEPPADDPNANVASPDGGLDLTADMVNLTSRGQPADVPGDNVEVASTGGIDLTSDMVFLGGPAGDGGEPDRTVALLTPPAVDGGGGQPDSLIQNVSADTTIYKLSQTDVVSGFSRTLNATIDGSGIRYGDYGFIRSIKPTGLPGEAGSAKNIVVKAINGGYIGLTKRPHVATLYDAKGQQLWSKDLDSLIDGRKVQGDSKKLNFELDVYDIAYQNGILFFNAVCPSYSADYLGKCSEVIALDAQSGDIKWRSNYLVSNSNIRPLGNVLVTGYGFTDENDFVYVLDAETGKTLQKLKVDSAPDAIGILDSQVVVGTYSDKLYKFAYGG